MKLYLMRHGEAEPKRANSSDAERPLTENGRKQAAEQAGRLKERGIKFDLIFSSPYLRAYQTAQIVAQELGLDDALSKEEALTSGCKTIDVMEFISQYNDLDSILCVGHEPDLGIIVGELQDLSAPQPLKKGQVVGFDLDTEEKIL